MELNYYRFTELNEDEMANTNDGVSKKLVYCGVVFVVVCYLYGLVIGFASDD